MRRICAFLLTAVLLCCGAVPAFAENDGAPEIRAAAAVLMDQVGGTVLFARNEHKKLYPASVTKVMSLLLFLEALEHGAFSLETTLTASRTAVSKGGSQIWLKEGEQMTVDELLRAPCDVKKLTFLDTCLRLLASLSRREGRG